MSAGTGISVVINSASSTEINARFNIAADAPGGNHAVTVTTSTGLSSNPSGNFFVQIPSRIVPHDIPGRTTNGKGPVVVVNNGDIVDLSGNVLASNQCGVYQNVAYVLVDQQG